jgi:hypothetical protein
VFAALCKLGYVLSANRSLRFLAVAHAIFALIDLLPFGALDGARVLPALKAPGRERVLVAVAFALLVTCAFALL